MAVKSALFVFEVVVEKVSPLIEARCLIIRSEFADIFALELKDPKLMNIVIPEPPPLPPEPPGKKKKKKPKPKKKKKGKEPPPPPEPIIQAGQSVLFNSNAEFLIQTMKKFPMELSLWTTEDSAEFIGSCQVTWDPAFISYLEKIFQCEVAQPVTVRDEYNVFEEASAKLMAKIGLQVKLSYMTDCITSSFRTLTEDEDIRKVLYTGMNSKVTSYVVNYKTTDKEFDENCKKVENKFIKERKLEYADYKNAPPANVALFSDGDYCCFKKADKPPESIYRAPETCPDIEFICDYIRKVITSCNDSMRRLTPRPTIRPRFKASDVDRLCYCRETRWPDGDLAQRFKKEVKSGPCPLCINAKPKGTAREKTFDIANIRGPCGRPDCRIARDLRAYLEKLVEEDNEIIDIDEIFGPCGSTACTLAEKLQKFLRHEGIFKGTYTKEGLSTQCNCMETMQKALMKKESCDSICSKDCPVAAGAHEEDAEDSHCRGDKCPFKKHVHAHYFTVEYDFEQNRRMIDKKKRSLSSSESEKQEIKLMHHASSSKSSSEEATSSNIQFAVNKNAPAANLLSLEQTNTNDLQKTELLPGSCADIESICNNVKKTIASCTDDLKRLTPQPLVQSIPKTSVNTFCYCIEEDLVNKFKKDVQSKTCPLRINDEPDDDNSEKDLDIENIRGPCGKPDCETARIMKNYIQDLEDEDNEIIDINEIYGPCGKSCGVAEKIRNFLRHEKEFSTSNTKETTQCSCEETMEEALFNATCESNEKVCGELEKNDSLDDKGYPKKNKERVYTVYYFTVEYNVEKDTPSSTSKSEKGSKSPKDKKSETSSVKSESKSEKEDKSKAVKIKSDSQLHHSNALAKFKHCGSLCPSKTKAIPSCSKVTCAEEFKKLGKGKKPELSPKDSNFVITLEDIKNPCCIDACNVAETLKDFIEDSYIKQKAKSPYTKQDDPCYCDCTCTFEFSSKTTYCGVCGGYECLGEDVKNQPDYAKPHPCPIYHKMFNRKYIDVVDPFPEQPEENQVKPLDSSSLKSVKSKTMNSRQSVPADAAIPEKQTKKEQPEKPEKKKKEKKTEKPVVAETKEIKKKVKKKRQLRPNIPFVPPDMGWLWDAEDIPGLEPRPEWKPGAAHKVLARKYRSLRVGADIIAKRKKALAARKKKLEPKPLLVVSKTDGEYTVQMEVFKKYSKERLLNQYPYEETTPITYSIGKTALEKRKIQQKRERRERRENRRRCKLIQSTFRDKCKEICLKAYNQCIGELPLPDLNKPPCPCEEEDAKVPTPVIDSCSCSESDSISSSDTDGDDWVIEFSPPVARWNQKAKPPPSFSNNSCQYNYLDYRVKCLDKQGNQVPRFFRGPDGRQECSDLGGFWGPGHVWLEINKDGYIGPDNRWVPVSFFGPDGTQYTSEEGSFTDSNGRTYKIGVDGYVDKDGKWVFYAKMRRGKESLATVNTKNSKVAGNRNGQTGGCPSTKGNTSPIKSALAKSKATDTGPPAKKAQAGNTGGASRGGKTTVMNVGIDYDRYTPFRNSKLHVDRYKSLEAKRQARYEEIMEELRHYDDICELPPSPMKTNRASNTPRKKVSPFTMDNAIKTIMPEFRNTDDYYNNEYN